MIKGFVQTNNLAAAQAMILQELRGEFGGAARAVGDTGVGTAAQLSNAFGDLKETIGAELLPAMKQWAAWMKGNIPGGGIGVAGPAQEKTRVLLENEDEFGRIARRIRKAETRGQMEAAWAEMNAHLAMRDAEFAGDMENVDSRWNWWTKSPDQRQAMRDEIARRQRNLHALAATHMDVDRMLNAPAQMSLLPAGFRGDEMDMGQQFEQMKRDAKADEALQRKHEEHLKQISESTKKMADKSEVAVFAE